MVNHIFVSYLYMKYNSYIYITRVNVFAAGYKNKDQQLIELQDSGARQQLQLQEEADLRALQEQEQSIRQLEVDSIIIYLILLNTQFLYLT